MRGKKQDVSFRNILWYLIKKYPDKLDWRYISKNPNFLTTDHIKNDQILEKYQKKLEDYEMVKQLTMLKRQHKKSINVHQKQEKFFQQAKIT